MTRPREHISANLESLYREAYTRARDAGDTAGMARLDFDFRRDQLYLEAVLDVRDLLAGLPPAAPPAPGEKKEEKSVLQELSDLRSLTRFPFGR